MTHELPTEPPAPDRPVHLPRPRVGVAPAAGTARVSAYVCEAVSCLSAQSHEILTGLGAEVATAGLIDIAIKRVGCLG
ncbi:MAG: hypothetical protein LH650_09505, partial [Chloroflexi bacterium]|nr:hypothetical protein [Chloroflexota bacterium]